MIFPVGNVYVVITHGSCVDKTTAVLIMKTTTTFYVTHLNTGITVGQAAVRDNSDMLPKRGHTPITKMHNTVIVSISI